MFFRRYSVMMIYAWSNGFIVCTHIDRKCLQPPIDGHINLAAGILFTLIYLAIILLKKEMAFKVHENQI